MAEILSGSGFEFELSSVGGIWRWSVCANNIYGLGQLYQVDNIRTPYGILQQTLIPIPSDVIDSMSNSILQIKQQFAPLMYLVSPSSLIFTGSVTEGGSSIEIGEVTLQNVGAFGSFMDVTATSGSPWLRADPISAKGISKNSTTKFKIYANPTSLLNSGSPYSGTIIFQDNRVPSTVITATIILTVNPRPVITATPSDIILSYNLISQSAGGAQQLTIQNNGVINSVLNAALAKVLAQPWWTFTPISVGPLASGANSIITISVVSGSVPGVQGTYTDKLRVSSSNATNSPTDINITLIVS